MKRAQWLVTCDRFNKIKLNHMKKNYILSSTIMLYLAFLSVTTTTQAQNIGINATGAAPDAGAMLDISSTNKGLLVPRVNITNLATIAPITGSATVSMLVYNTNTTTGVGYHYWNGASWVRLSTGDAWELTGNAGTNAATNFLGTTDNIDFSIRRSNLERFRLNATSVVFNENSYNYDFRIESNNQANIFFIDAGSDEIGIRTNAPTSMLHMTNGGINVGANAMAAYDNLGADGVAISGYNQGTGNGYNGIEGITAGTYSGVMGLGITQGAGGDGVLGSTNDWQSIGVVGTRFNSGGANTGFGGLFVNDLGYTGWFGNVSDKRLKKDITKINNALSILTQLNPVKYYFDIEKYPNMGLNTELEYGFIAQEVNDILPEIIREKLFPTNGASETKLNTPKENQEELFFAMDYTRLIPIAIQAIKEQQTIIEAQNTKIEALEKIVLELQKAIETK